MTMAAPPPLRGFTLIELVLVIVITGIIATLTTVFIARPLQGYVDVNRRSALVDEADLALRRITRDVSAALPGSVRVGNGDHTLELLAVSAGGRYRAEAGTTEHTGAEAWLDFTSTDDRFNILGLFDPAGGSRLAIVPAGTSADTLFQDYVTGAQPGTITPAATSVTVTQPDDEARITLSPGFRFRPDTGDQHRLYAVSGPVMYHCDPAAGRLTRHAGYNPTAALPATLPNTGALLAGHVASCEFYIHADTGVLTLSLELADGGEPIRLLQQVQVENTP